MEKKNNSNKTMIPIIYTPGINQLYYIDFNYLTYIDIEKEITSIIQSKNHDFANELSKILTDFEKNVIVNYSDFKKILFEKINININTLLEYLDLWIKNNVNYMHKNQISFMKSIIGNIYNNNPFHLLIDELCLTEYQKQNNISLNFFTEKELLYTDKLQNLILNDNNKIFLYSYDPIVLVSFKEKLKQNNNIFTFLLNTYLFCFKDLIPNSEEEKITKKIKNYFDAEKNKNNIYHNSEYIINSDINFISNNIFSYNYLYYEIINQKISTYESLIKYFNEVQPKTVLVFTRFLTRKQNFVKQRYFISEKDIIYKPHYGGIDLICNGKIDIVLAKSYELKDYEEYKNIFNFLKNNYRMANDISNFNFFVDKNLQDKFLNNFCDLINNNDILINSNEQKFRINTIKSISIDIKHFKDKNYILNALQKNKIKFPIILKYTSDNPTFKHQATIILNENFLNNFINNYINKICDEKYNITVLIQHITQHGGYVLKVYHLGNKNYIDYRSSIIDIDENNKKLVDELFGENGFWNFKTIMLESEEYKKGVWSKYISDKDGVEKKVKNNKKLFEFLLNVVNLFEIYSHMGLFGIDILIDNENKLYIIDANSLPGYKKGFNIEEDLRNYFRIILL